MVGHAAKVPAAMNRPEMIAGRSPTRWDAAARRWIGRPPPPSLALPAMTLGGRTRAVRWAALGVATALAVLPACGGGGEGSDADGAEPPQSSRAATATDAAAGTTTTTLDAATAHMATTATAIGPSVQVYATAGESQPTTALANPNENGAPLVFLAETLQGDWVEVLLPIRPNGSTGWIKASDVTLARNPYQIEVRLADHRIVVHEGDEVILDEPIAVGTADTPTPGGRYYIKELLKPPDPNGPYGTYAYGLSGFSNELESFNGGDGVIGIHGTNDPASIGTDVSHGCIRMTNEAITRLAGILPLGTPVHIAA
jgi:lipoprotein-anchoring transpeptidase ErfK/SrfK